MFLVSSVMNNKKRILLALSYFSTIAVSVFINGNSKSVISVKLTTDSCETLSEVLGKALKQANTGLWQVPFNATVSCTLHKSLPHSVCFLNTSSLFFPSHTVWGAWMTSWRINFYLNGFIFPEGFLKSLFSAVYHREKSTLKFWKRESWQRTSDCPPAFMYLNENCSTCFSFFPARQLSECLNHNHTQLNTDWREAHCWVSSTST